MNDIRRLGLEAESLIQQLAQISDEPCRLTRLFLSDSHKQAVEQVAQWFNGQGLETAIDALGTVHGLLQPSGSGSNRKLLIGSHIDTVVDAGKYDGTLGVIAGLLAIKDLQEEGASIPFSIELLAFGDEEGVRFPTTLASSSAVAGILELDALEHRDGEGKTLRDALIEFGGDPDDVMNLKAGEPDGLVGYLEVHIEQGPVLQYEDRPVGIVTALAAARRGRFRFTGEAGHAGTVPMELRKDPMIAASKVIGAFPEIALRYSDQNAVATVGNSEVSPGAINVIAGDVVFSFDIRAKTEEARDGVFDDIAALAKRIADETGCALEIETFYQSGATQMSEPLSTAIAHGCQAMGVEPRYLFSGAGHDGHAMGKLTDVGMIFVRCKDGISHNPAEFTSVDDMGTAVLVLKETILELARREAA